MYVYIFLPSISCATHLSGVSESLLLTLFFSAAQCQPLFASDAQQHHPQPSPSRSPTTGRSVEHGPDGGLSDGGWRLHGCVGGGGAEPLRSLRRGGGGNRALSATGAAGGGGGGQGEVNVGERGARLHKMTPSVLISNHRSAEQAQVPFFTFIANRIFNFLEMYDVFFFILD